MSARPARRALWRFWGRGPSPHRVRGTNRSRSSAVTSRAACDTDGPAPSSVKRQVAASRARPRRPGRSARCPDASSRKCARKAGAPMSPLPDAAGPSIAMIIRASLPGVFDPAAKRTRKSSMKPGKLVAIGAPSSDAYGGLAPPGRGSEKLMAMRWSRWVANQGPPPLDRRAFLARSSCSHLPGGQTPLAFRTGGATAARPVAFLDPQLLQSPPLPFSPVAKAAGDGEDRKIRRSSRVRARGGNRDALQCAMTGAGCFPRTFRPPVLPFVDDLKISAHFPAMFVKSPVRCGLSSTSLDGGRRSPV